jgi:hypothetical protein
MGKPNSGVLVVEEGQELSLDASVSYEINFTAAPSVVIVGKLSAGDLVLSLDLLLFLLLNITAAPSVVIVGKPSSGVLVVEEGQDLSFDLLHFHMN